MTAIAGRRFEWDDGDPEAVIEWYNEALRELLIAMTCTIH